MTDPQAALKAQVGGSHYKKGIQPFQLSMANGHDGCIHAIQKYLTRFARVGRQKGYESLSKAHHICMIRVETMTVYGVPHAPDPMIGIGDYIRSNELDLNTANVVRMVEAWHMEVDIDHHARAEAIRACIRHVAESHYPEIYKDKDFSA